MKYNNFKATKAYSAIGDIADDTVIALLAPRKHNETYDKRFVMFSSDVTKIREHLSNGWDAMLARHYYERKALDSYKPEDHSYLRGITDHVYHPELKRKDIKWPLQKKNVQ
jgi:hypothetical protein|tara:strand:+ start:126 stop:458 length:333 start_codon:yes stop_codon:yes gene_type:complete